MDKKSIQTSSHPSDRDLLAYYHSPRAAQGHCYQLARLSSSSCEDSDGSSQVTRNANRRQVAIVEMDSPEEENDGLPGTADDGCCTLPGMADDSCYTLRSRRGLHSGLAVVAPSNSSFILLTPPSTAPLSASRTHCQTSQNLSIASRHQRSTSESLPRTKFPLRDIGIVGTTRLASRAKHDTNLDKSLPDMYASDNNNTSFHPPIFQQPKSSAPSPESYQSFQDPSSPAASNPVRGLKIMKRAKTQEPLPTHSSLPKKNPAPSLSPQLAPETREKKFADVPVVLPIAVGLESTIDADAVLGDIRLVAQPKASSPPTLALPATDSALSYVNYEPGVHSTAGPLPPPPRLPGFDGHSTTLIFPPPPRPPRLNSPLPLRNPARSKDIEAVKQALQLPSSVSAALASRTRTKSGESLLKDTTAESPSPNATRTGIVSSTIPSSSLSSMSSSHSVLHNVTTVRRHEGEKAPSTYDVGSLDSESQPEKDDTSKRTLFTNSATNVIPATGGQVKDDEEQAVKATTRSKSSLIPSPTLEEPTASDSPKGSDDVVPLQPRLHREYGSVVTMGNSNDDSDEYWVAISRASSPSNRDDRSIPLLSSGARNEAPSPPPKSFRNSLTTGLKRFSSRSLPRTPSISSGGSRRSSVISKRFSTGSTSLTPLNGATSISTTASHSGSANVSVNGSASGRGSNTSNMKTPQVASIPRRATTALGYALPNAHGGVTGYSASVDGHGVMKSTMRKRQKTVVQWPSAMFCNEIHATNGKKKLSSGEKCAIYAQKINELYMYDCGLTEWVVEMKFRSPSSNPGAGGPSKKFLDARSPTSVSFTPQPRQTSRSSVISDATFPTRPDAITATDLLSSSYDDDGVYREDVPPLPYPSLATAQRAAASNAASVVSPSTSNTTLMTVPAPLRSSGSNSTLPSLGGGSAHTHPPASILTNSSTSSNSATIPLSPISTSIKHPTVTSLSSTSSSTGGFFATLGRKASLSSAKRPTLGLGLSNLISSSLSPSSPSGGSSSLTSGRRLLTKSTSGLNGGGTRFSTLTSPKSPIGGGLQMNTASPPSVVPGGPRALMSHNNRVQRSKTFIPSTGSPLNGYGGGLGSGLNGGVGVVDVGGRDSGGMIERRPSLWELQLNSTDLTSDGRVVVAPISSGPTSGSNMFTHNFSSQPHPYANPLVMAGYMTDSSQLTHRHHHSQSYIPTTVRYSQQQEQQQQAVYDPQLEPEFLCQVDKLADLLPHADRNILSGYLRRAGQDILAIGQYLEDEKNGTLKTD